MTPLAPVDFSSSAPFDPVSYYLHMVIGLIGLIAAIIAFSSRKGGPRHVFAGRVFAVCILIVSLTSVVMLLVRVAPPLIVSTAAAIYAIGTALLALKPSSALVRSGEIGLAVIQILAIILFLSIAIPEVAAGTIPPIGPMVIIAIPIFLLFGDINFFMKSKQRRVLGVRRHLSRMIWAFVVAVRAPIVEVNGSLQIPVPVILFLPLLVAPMIIWFVLRRYPIREREG